MGKVFEDFFSEIQADMVSICLEYASNMADEIYIYCSCEAKVISCDFFYRINNKLVERHKLNDAIMPQEDKFMYDTSISRQSAALEIIQEDIEKIVELCKEFHRDMPTEMKLVYNVKRNSLVAKYKYDMMYSNDSEKTSDDIANEWFEEMRNSLMNI